MIHINSSLFVLDLKIVSFHVHVNSRKGLERLKEVDY
jgi:hypothetical protein